ncbi:MAG: gamma-glutamylcyclotransferase [Sedimentisphaerales bacterium]|nr:gamma-glutamylcyclotransferase [Sedimentisphaerales bacterium]
MKRTKKKKRVAGDKVNLFIYGSLRDPKIFESVCGRSFTRKSQKTDEWTLLAEPAFLAGHKKVSPDNVYFYAVATPGSKIEGFIIYDVPAEAMAEIDKYEGKRYERQTIRVHTGRGLVTAQAYLVSPEAMKKHFGDRFHVNLIHELWLRKRIERFLKKRTRPGEKSVDAELERLAVRELLATTERDLVITHYRSDAVSDYYLEHELNRPIPSIKPLYDDLEASKYIKNYLALVVKQVLLNQLDERIQANFRFELEHMRSSERYFKRSVSLLIALQIMNNNVSAVEMIVRRSLQAMPFRRHDLIDYVKYAVRAARSLFDARVAEAHLNAIRSNFQPGLVPMGCEIEMSNVGAAVVEPGATAEQKNDPVYDCFRYFCDFQLDVLSWKLGGYIDDNSGSDERTRRQGFLEMAPGRLNVAMELSRPATACPWLLNQLINEITAFYGVHPHSLHLSFQLRKLQLGKQKTLPLGFVKCLLVLGGGTEVNKMGRLWVSRMGHDEITRQSDTAEAGSEELVFARTSERRWFVGAGEVGDKTPLSATTHVQQYKFIRLEQRANYEPLIMCLKGLQLGYNPADYLTAEQLKKSAKLRREYEELKNWSASPVEIGHKMIRSFLKTVRDGLMNEGHRRLAHQQHYIEWALAAIDMRLRTFNEQLTSRD